MWYDACKIFAPDRYYIIEEVIRMDAGKILSLLWARSETAIEALALNYGRRLYQTAFNILSDRLDAEECVDDTYLAVWNAIPPRKPDPLAGFVFRTGRNISLNRLRSRQADKRNSSYDLSLDELAGCIPAPALEEQLDARALGQAIDRFLEEQTRENRILFIRRYWFGDSVRDLAQLLTIKENAVSVRLSRLRDKLKDYLTKEGLFDAAEIE